LKIILCNQDDIKALNQALAQAASLWADEVIEALQNSFETFTLAVQDLTKTFLTFDEVTRASKIKYHKYERPSLYPFKVSVSKQHRRYIIKGSRI
jgi:hypothetical protein